MLWQKYRIAKIQNYKNIELQNYQIILFCTGLTPCWYYHHFTHRCDSFAILIQTPLPTCANGSVSISCDVTHMLTRSLTTKTTVVFPQSLISGRRQTGVLFGGTIQSVFDNHALIEMLRMNTQGDSLGRLWAIFTVSKQKIADNWPQAWGFISRYQIFALIDKTLAVEYDTHSQMPNTPSWEILFYHLRNTLF